MSSRRIRQGPMTISQRAKEWHSSVFTVQWMENTFQACTTSPGKEKFEEWVVSRYGPSQGMAIVQECNKRSPQGTWVSNQPPKTFGEKTMFMWNSAAVFSFDFSRCVSRAAIQAWHGYAADMNLYQPERTKLPPKRRRGETSGQWISLVDGHKPPVIDLDYARRTAIAEYDKTLDTLERWRTDSELFFTDIVERSKSIIPSPRIWPLDARTKERTDIDDAFRTRINFLSIVHLAWKDAALLFEHLAAQGLNTPAAIERAYAKDTALLWRFMSVINRIAVMQRKMCANFQQLLAASEYYKPLLKPWRDNNGVAHIDVNRSEIDKLVKKGCFSAMDEVVVQFASSMSPATMSFFQGVETSIGEDRSEEKKFSAAVFEAMGDLAAASEFESQFTRTEFGTKLVNYAASLDKAGTDRAQMRSILYYMDPAKLADEPERYWDRAGEASRSIRALENAWAHRTWQLSINTILVVLQTLVGSGGLINQRIEMPTELFNEMWRRADEQLWNFAASLDRKGEKGRVAKEYGLWNPQDPDRPVATMYLFAEIELEIVMGVPLKAKTTPAFMQTIPIARPNESGAQSGHAYASRNVQNAKYKVKTRGEASKKAAVDEAVREELEVQIHSESFPTEFNLKMGNKFLRLFHRILEPPKEEKENAPAKGQVRWGDFENAMKRIGFQIVHTAGSSVRFDPPAPTARPITFHRPHPDSLLTPHAIKWLGARLKRTYGWTTMTFRGAEGEDAG
ncbi:hypothetical protein C8F01DRAFT_1101503 [Mycena amicta]|nr:hypothetical protein C8F01DRAFT_1101503 [Mycena amicta]